ncbi:hypothetical protein [Streptomyces aidingensis]|uniref:Uncharacterized protein n=1 Tax=Streptomyces aidingensis TaxID=910347 RepID=A0A1I1MFY9_9ACTN|nr:hypothetical protein [Streptomyces aidingensis]SFC84401.1 hypothetical protein SAMN05421773_106246 [Streptomyces aidingensis]
MTKHHTPSGASGFDGSHLTPSQAEGERETEAAAGTGNPAAGKDHGYDGMVTTPSQAEGERDEDTA